LSGGSDVLLVHNRRPPTDGDEEVDVAYSPGCVASTYTHARVNTEYHTQIQRNALILGSNINKCTIRYDTVD